MLKEVTFGLFVEFKYFCINMNILKNKKARFTTLGCKLNFAETSTLCDNLITRGVEIAANDEIADICVINTCSVTDIADHKCRQAIHRMLRENPGCLMVVMGCYAQLQPREIARFEGVDLVIGMEHKGQIISYIENALRDRSLLDGKACHEAVTVLTKDIKTFVPSCSHGDRTRYFLKVQDGCNYYCSYCTIPIARGRSRSGSVKDLVTSAQKVAKEGGKEIVLTGVNIGDFGNGTDETFLDLIKALDKVEGIERYRISSIEPNLLTDEIIDFCASSRAFMPHFHIPLQSGSDTVLKLMRRRYDTSLFREKIERVMRVRPNTFIGIDVIVGTRGETNELFEESFKFIESLEISQLHVFSYSERPGTKALEIPHVVSSTEKYERSNRLLKLSEEKRLDFYKKHIGTHCSVLWEHAKDEHILQGFTENYIRVETRPYSTPLRYDNCISAEILGSLNATKNSLIIE